MKNFFCCIQVLMSLVSSVAYANIKHIQCKAVLMVHNIDSSSREERVPLDNGVLGVLSIDVDVDAGPLLFEYSLTSDEGEKLRGWYVFSTDFSHVVHSNVNRFIVKHSLINPFTGEHADISSTKEAMDLDVARTSINVADFSENFYLMVELLNNRQTPFFVRGHKIASIAANCFVF